MTQHEAKAAGLTRYHGTPCRNCKGTERYTCSGACVACIKQRVKKNGWGTWAYRKMFQYGITRTQFDEMLQRQNNVCDICHQPFAPQSPCIDHDHTTGAIRGLLCNNCNVGLGCYKDNPEFLRNAIEYLRKNKVI